MMCACGCGFPVPLTAYYRKTKSEYIIGHAKQTVQLCACGCQQPAPIAKRNDPYCKKGEHRKYINGHHLQPYQFVAGDPRTTEWIVKLAIRMAQDMACA